MTMGTHNDEQTPPKKKARTADPDGLDTLAETGDIDVGQAPDASGGNGTQPPADVLVLEAKVTELSNQLLRALADVQNLRKRTEREKAEVHATAGASVLLELLPVLDELDRAAAHIPEDLQNHEWILGVMHVRSNLETTLKRLGVERFAAVGDAYNAERHEAIARAEGPENTIVQIFEFGYLQGERVLRPAKVVVGGGNAPADTPPPSAAEPAPPEGERVDGAG